MITKRRCIVNNNSVDYLTKHRHSFGFSPSVPKIKGWNTMIAREVFGALMILSLVLGACATPIPEPTLVPTDIPVEPMAMPEPEPMEIVDIAIADSRFSTLATVVQAWGLVDALKGEGPLTIFALTDGAFAALPEGAVEALLNDNSYPYQYPLPCCRG
jgi:hypothetical protein